jgi:nucleoside 2-deoxyribosyltransferase
MELIWDSATTGTGRRPVVYLSGPMTGQTYIGANDWRTMLTGFLDPAEYHCLSPMRGKEYLRGGDKIAESYTLPPHKQREILVRDYNDVRRADVVVVNLALQKDTASVGTIMEVAWAYAHRIPIVLIMGEGPNVHDHAMLRECVGWRVETLDEAAHIVRMIVGE